MRRLSLHHASHGLYRGEAYQEAYRAFIDEALPGEEKGEEGRVKGEG